VKTYLIILAVILGALTLNHYYYDDLIWPRTLIIEGSKLLWWMIQHPILTVIWIKNHFFQMVFGFFFVIYWLGTQLYSYTQPQRGLKEWEEGR